MAWDTVSGPGKMLELLEVSQPQQSGQCFLNTHLAADSHFLHRS